MARTSPLNLSPSCSIDGNEVEALITELFRLIEADVYTFTYLVDGHTRLDLNEHGRDNLLQEAANNIKSPLLPNRDCFYELGHSTYPFCHALYTRLKGRVRFKHINKHRGE